MITIRLLPLESANQRELDNLRNLIHEIFPDATVTLAGDDIFILAEDEEGEQLGFAHLSERSGSILLKGIGVRETVRQQGIGTMLMEGVIDVTDSDPRPIYLKVKSLNPAISFYERHGFVIQKFGGTSHVLTRRRLA